MVNSNRKGKTGENAALALLNTLCGGSDSNKLFRRSGLGFGGEDIANKPIDFPYAVEVKNHAGVKLCHFFYKPTKKLLEFIQQAEEQCKPGEYPMLLVKVESKWCIAIRDDDSHLLINNETPKLEFDVGLISWQLYEMEHLIKRRARIVWGER